MHFTPSLKRQNEVPVGQHNLKTNQSFLVNNKIEAISFCINHIILYNVLFNIESDHIIYSI